MKTTLSILFIIGCVASSHAQQTNSYQNGRGERHLCGPLQISDLQWADFKTWYDTNYDDFTLDDPAKWKKQLKNTQVDIFLGTWCGDSKYWVPRFIKLWDELGLDRSQLRLVALYNDQDRYKQGPNHEEAGKKIHRVPTFVFNKDGKEYARMVESPTTNLVTDVAQIALDYPSTPNYAAAEYLLELLASQSPEMIQNDFKKHIRATNQKVKKPSELNTLGYVLQYAGQLEQALVVFKINTLLFPYYANTYDSYAETLAKVGRIKEAIIYYNKVLDIETDNEHALNQIAQLSDESVQDILK